MSRSRKSPRATLDAWRAQGAERLDPVRFHFIDALERRSSSQDGEARRLLDEKLARLLASYADDLRKSARRDSTVGTTPCMSGSDSLAALVTEIADRTNSRESHRPGQDMTALPASPRELPALDDFRKIWSSVRGESQLRQSLEQVPTDAGPLNSASLVHRALTLMRDLSPGYLQHLLAYVDAVSWAEQLHGSVAAGKDGSRATTGGKRPRRKPRATS